MRVQAIDILGGLALSLLSLAAHAAQNYCHDRSVNAAWGRLLVEHEGDPDFTYRYDLCKQLCAAVDAGRMTLNAAIDRFEYARRPIIEDKSEQLEERGNHR